MKEDRFYDIYVNFLEAKLAEGKISKGSFSLMRISGDNFNRFKNKIERDKLFETEQIKSYRDRKIDGILYDID